MRVYGHINHLLRDPCVFPLYCHLAYAPSLQSNTQDVRSQASQTDPGVETTLDVAVDVRVGVMVGVRVGVNVGVGVKVGVEVEVYVMVNVGVRVGL